MEHIQVGLAYNLHQINRFAATSNRSLWVCSAYASLSGVEAVGTLLDSAHAIEAILGAGPLTDPAAIRRLQAHRANVRLFPHTPQSEFHPKCYFGIRSDEAWAVIGSANLTGRGAEGNIELMAMVTGPVDHAFFGDLTEWLQEIRSFSLDLSPEILQFVSQAHQAYQAVAASVEANVTLPPRAFSGLKRLSDRVHQEALLTYIKTTRLFASYKLVMLALLLHAPHGRLHLSECARRFHHFYLELDEAGVQPERSTGNPPPRMLTPRLCSPPDVERLLLDAPREAFANTGGIVVYTSTKDGFTVSIARPLWRAMAPNSTAKAFAALLDRLEEYYQSHVGTSRFVRDILERLVVDHRADM